MIIIYVFFFSNNLLCRKSFSSWLRIQNYLKTFLNVTYMDGNLSEWWFQFWINPLCAQRRPNKFFNESRKQMRPICKSFNCNIARAEISITMCKINVYIVPLFSICILQKLNLSHLIYIFQLAELKQDSSTKCRHRLPFHAHSFTHLARSNVVSYFLCFFFMRACVCVLSVF